jgi:hypothetical protein
MALVYGRAGAKNDGFRPGQKAVAAATVAEEGLKAAAPAEPAGVWEDPGDWDSAELLEFLPAAVGAVRVTRTSLAPPYSLHTAY